MADPRVKWTQGLNFNVPSSGAVPDVLTFPALRLSTTAIMVVQVAYFPASAASSIPCVATFADGTTLSLLQIDGQLFTLEGQGGIYWASDARFAQGGSLSLTFTGIPSSGVASITALIADGGVTGPLSLQAYAWNSSSFNTATILGGVRPPWTWDELAIVLSGDNGRHVSTPMIVTPGPGDPNWTLLHNLGSPLVSAGGSTRGVAQSMLTYSASSYPISGCIFDTGMETVNSEPTWVVGYTVKGLAGPTVPPTYPPVPHPPILDLADTPSRLYLVYMSGAAWLWTEGGRTPLYIDRDNRQLALGMVAVATAGEAAYYVDWNGQLWETGFVYRPNEVTGEWEQVQQEWLSPVPINADKITLMGPHGIGPAYMNDTALWVTSGTRLIGLGPHPHAVLMNGLLPSSPDPIQQPTQGAYAWSTSRDPPPATRVTDFDYRRYTWASLAESNRAAYGQFSQKAGRAPRLAQVIG